MFRLVQEIEFTEYPEYNYHFEIESDGSPSDHENTVKLCYKGVSCDTDNKVRNIHIAWRKKCGISDSHSLEVLLFERFFFWCNFEGKFIICDPSH